MKIATKHNCKISCILSVIYKFAEVKFDTNEFSCCHFLYFLGFSTEGYTTSCQSKYNSTLCAKPHVTRFFPKLILLPY